jgi:hypothetical protein
MKGIDLRREKIIGREHIKLTDAFFELPYITRYMKDKGLSRDTFPPLVMQ